jgi:hypothetical protein
MASASNKTIKGFAVQCPYCGDREAAVKIDLNDLGACVCSSCDEEFSARDAAREAAEQLKRWEAVVRWVEMAGQALAECERVRKRKGAGVVCYTAPARNP